MTYPKIASLNAPEKFRAHLDSLSLFLPFDDELRPPDQSPLARPLKTKTKTCGNRFCILPMEGWDGTRDGKPTDLTRRRWRHFGLSGAKLIWGGEAVAVRHDGRANPNQLLINEANLTSLESLKDNLLDEHRSCFSATEDLLVGLQLTHSGRFARPNDNRQLEPRTVYRHPFLDQKYQCDAGHLLKDSDLDQLVDDFITAAKMASKIGFEFVDIKHCHGYLGHELLSAYDRTGKYGGSFENRTRFLREVVSGIKSEVPGLEIGVRVSVFDLVPFVADVDGTGRPWKDVDYRFGFGSDSTGLGVDLQEPIRFMELLQQLGIELVCSTAGNPYANPHIQRPAIFPPSDGYLPPEDPLVGVARQIEATGQLKQSFPELIMVGSGYSYLQEWIPNVGQAVIRNRLADSIGLGRSVLSYPNLSADVLAGRSLQRKKVCRTFSDCTTAPRNSLVSGCYPLDGFYKSRPEAKFIKELKAKK